MKKKTEKGCFKTLFKLSPSCRQVSISKSLQFQFDSFFSSGNSLEKRELMKREKDEKWNSRQSICYCWLQDSKSKKISSGKRNIVFIFISGDLVACRFVIAVLATLAYPINCQIKWLSNWILIWIASEILIYVHAKRQQPEQTELHLELLLFRNIPVSRNNIQ